MSVTVSNFGKLSTGAQAKLYHIENAGGSYADVTDFGAILVRLCVPDKDGVLRDVVLGYDDLSQYEVNGCFFGATIGRNGNRIGKARFCIDGKEYKLFPNEFENNLHSQPDGFEKKLWIGSPVDGKNAVRFSRLSPDGESGFPGNLEISVTYELTDSGELCLTYEGISDQATVVNCTNHTYFNLNGEGEPSTADTLLTLHADYFTPVPDSASIPTGELRAVAGTPMDFREPKPIGKEADADYDQLQFTGGYDHNYVVNGYEKGKVQEIACACSEKSGIAMTVLTDCPCVQFYGGNFIVSEHGKNGHTYIKRNGFCLETQVEPNAVNEPAFHSPVIAAGEKYLSRTIYRFTVV